MFQYMYVTTDRPPPAPSPLVWRVIRLRTVGQSRGPCVHVGVLSPPSCPGTGSHHLITAAPAQPSPPE